MIARLAYLTTPSPGVYVLNLQPVGQERVDHYVISEAHLANITIDGTQLLLRRTFAYQAEDSEAAG